MEAFTVADFSGGVTDFVTRSSPKHMEESCNLVVTSDRKLALREGIDFVEGSDVVFPEQKIFELAYIQTDKSNDRIILCDHNYYEFKDLLEDYQVVTIDGEATAVSVSGDYTFPQGIKSDLAPFALMNDQVISGSERFGTQTNKLRGEPVRYPIYSTTQWNDHLIVASDGEPELPVSLIYKSETYRPIIEDGRNIGEEKIARAFTRDAGLGAIPSDIEHIDIENADDYGLDLRAIITVLPKGNKELSLSYRYAICLANEYVVDGTTHVERGPVYYFREPVRTTSDFKIGDLVTGESAVEDVLSITGARLGIIYNDVSATNKASDILAKLLPPRLNERIKLRTDISDYVKPPDDADVFRWQIEPYWNLKLEIYRTPEGTNQFFRVGAVPFNTIDSLTKGLNVSNVPFLKKVGLKTQTEWTQENKDSYLLRYFPPSVDETDAAKRRAAFENLFVTPEPDILNPTPQPVLTDNFQSFFLAGQGEFVDYIRDEDLV